jgi:flagellar motor switch protein FliG
MAENKMPAEANQQELLANLSKVERAAILLMSLGEKDAAEIFKTHGA